MVGDVEIPIGYCKVAPSYSVCIIFLCADVEAEPGTIQVIGSRLEDRYDQNAGIPGMFKESKELRGKSEISVARTLVFSRASRQLSRQPNSNLFRSFCCRISPICTVNGSVNPLDPN